MSIEANKLFFIKRAVKPLFRLALCGLMFQAPCLPQHFNTALSHETILNPTNLTAEGELFDYCASQSDNSVPTSYAADGSPARWVFRGDLEKIQDLEVTPDLLFNVVPATFDKMQVVLVPVGFTSTSEQSGLTDEDRSQMYYLTSRLQNAFAGVGIDFSYFTHNVPVSIARNNRTFYLPNKDEKRIFSEKLADIFPIHKILFVRNTNEAGGTALFEGIYANSPAFGENALFTASHETAHLLGLPDAYKALYRVDHLSATELFTSTASLKPLVRETYESLDPQPEITAVDNSICGPWQIYRFGFDSFYTDFNIMRKNYLDNDLEKLISKRIPIFNSLQLEYMKRFVEHQSKL